MTTTTVTFRAGQRWAAPADCHRAERLPLPHHICRGLECPVEGPASKLYNPSCHCIQGPDMVTTLALRSLLQRLLAAAVSLRVAVVLAVSQKWLVAEAMRPCHPTYCSCPALAHN